jgi:hypothetical protein
LNPLVSNWRYPDSEKNRIGIQLATRSQQCGHIKNQGHAAITQNRGTRNTRHLAEIRFQVLDNDLLPANTASIFGVASV